jgi:hypothetical protein
MFKWFKSLFNSIPEIKQIKEPITIATVDIFDTVWVKDEDIIIEGWIYDKTKNRFIVVAGNNEYIFHYKRPYDQQEIVNNQKVLYFNYPCD